MLRIDKNIWIKPDHISDIIINQKGLSLTSTSGVTYFLKDTENEYLENVCVTFALNFGEIKIAIQKNKKNN